MQRIHGLVFAGKRGQPLEWSFGDGETSNEQHPSHAYAADGTYTVSLTAASASGSDVQVRTDYITVPEPVASLQLLSGCLLLADLSRRRAKRTSIARLRQPEASRTRGALTSRAGVVSATAEKS